METVKMEDVLVDSAWNARDNAIVPKTGTKVGCAMHTSRKVVTGWNIEGLWCTSIHAEVSATTSLVPGEKVKKIAIVAETEQFTPCGACMDWLMQFAVDDEVVVITENKKRERNRYRLKDLMGHYPRM